MGPATREKRHRPAEKRRRAPAPPPARRWRRWRPGVENARGQGSLLLGEPFRHGLDAGRKVGRFAQSQKEHGDAEGEHGIGGGRSHGGHAPQHDRQRETAARAQAVRQPAGTDQPDGISRLKGRRHVAVFLPVPPDDSFQRLFQVGQHAAIHIGDYGGQEQQRADVPAKTRRGGAENIADVMTA